MASHSVQGTPLLSLRNGCRCVTEPGVTVEDVLLAVGEQSGFDNIVSASRMNKAVVVFLKSEALVNELTVNGIWVKEAFVSVTPLTAPATRVTVSNVPPFVPNEMIMKELARFGKVAGPMRLIPLGCKDVMLKHVLSFRRQVHMILTAPEKSLEIAFCVNHGDASYMIYASAENLKCFDCGDVGHKRLSCPHKNGHNDQVLLSSEQLKESVNKESNGSSKQTKVQSEKTSNEVSGNLHYLTANEKPSCSHIGNVDVSVELKVANVAEASR